MLGCHIVIILLAVVLVLPPFSVKSARGIPINANLLSLPPFQVQSTTLSETQWNRTYGGPNEDRARSIVQASDGGYAIAGYTTSYGAGSHDGWLVKTDKLGNVQWNRTYGSTGPEQVFCIIQTGDGGYLLAGGVTSYGGVDGWLLKTNASGFSMWEKHYRGSEYKDVAFDVVSTDDGGYAFAGYTRGKYFWLVKTDADGNELWSKSYAGLSGSVDSAYSLLQTSDGGFVVVGTGNGGSSLDYTWLIRTNAFGEPEWNKTYSDGGFDRASDIIHCSDGGYLIAGTTTISAPDRWQARLIRVDSFGNALWNNTYGEVDDTWGECVVRTSSGGYALAGSVLPYNADNSDFLLVKVDENGEDQWTRTPGGQNPEHAYCIVQTEDGGYALAGYTKSVLSSYDFLVIKTDEFGIVPVPPIEEAEPYYVEDSFREKSIFSSWLGYFIDKGVFVDSDITVRIGNDSDVTKVELVYTIHYENNPTPKRFALAKSSGDEYQGNIKETDKVSVIMTILNRLLFTFTPYPGIPLEFHPRFWIDFPKVTADRLEVTTPTRMYTFEIDEELTVARFNEFPSGEYVWVACDVDVLITDEQGRRLGSVYEEGVYMGEINEIPGSTCSGHGYPTFAYTPRNIATIEVIGEEEGNYSLYLVEIVDGETGDYLSKKNASTTTYYRERYRVEDNFILQYYLTVHSEYGDPDGEGWYDEGTTASFSVTSPAGFTIQPVFAVWGEDVSATTPSATVVMDSHKTVVASWRTDYTQLLAIIAVLTTVVAVSAGAVYLKKRKPPTTPSPSQRVQNNQSE